ncbi:MAG: glycosyltransferase family 2 protein [Phycisphaeraceae bacterium]
MSDLPTITVITPSYNQAEFLEATLKSVLEQNYPNLQYGVVDGASTDGSREILEKYRPRIEAAGGFVLSEPDRGQVDALNKGLRRATGDVVCYINSDDTLLPGCLQTVGEHFAANPDCHWLLGDCQEIDPAGRVLQALTGAAPRDLAHALIRVEPFMMPQPSVFWRRSLLDEHGLFDERFQYSFDFEMWCRFLVAGHRPERIDAALATYRMHPQSKTCAEQHRHLANKLIIEAEYARHLAPHDRRRLRKRLGYRRRAHAVMTRSRGGLAVQVLAKPWWLGSQQIRTALAGREQAA